MKRFYLVLAAMALVAAALPAQINRYLLLGGDYGSQVLTQSDGTVTVTTNLTSFGFSMASYQFNGNLPIGLYSGMNINGITGISVSDGTTNATVDPDLYGLKIFMSSLMGLGGRITLAPVDIFLSVGIGYDAFLLLPGSSTSEDYSSSSPNAADCMCVGPGADLAVSVPFGPQFGLYGGLRFQYELYPILSTLSYVKNEVILLPSLGIFFKF